MTNLCSKGPIFRIISTSLGSALDLVHCYACTIFPSVWKKDTTFHMNWVLYYCKLLFSDRLFSVLVTYLILSPVWSVPWQFTEPLGSFLGAPNDCKLLSILKLVSNSLYLLVLEYVLVIIYYCSTTIMLSFEISWTFVVSGVVLKGLFVTTGWCLFCLPNLCEKSIHIIMVYD